MPSSRSQIVVATGALPPGFCRQQITLLVTAAAEAATRLKGFRARSGATSGNGTGVNANANATP